jgi:hypothetical protein
MNDIDKLSVTFYQRLDKADKRKTAPIYMRITVNGRRAEIATGKRFDISRWENGHVVGLRIDARELQMDLEIMKATINRIWRDMSDANEGITAIRIKERFTESGQMIKTRAKKTTRYNELKFEED